MLEPNTNLELSVAKRSQETLELLMLRRSLTVKDMVHPGPNEEQLKQILEIGSRVWVASKAFLGLKFNGLPAKQQC